MHKEALDLFEEEYSPKYETNERLGSLAISETAAERVMESYPYDVDLDAESLYMQEIAETPLLSAEEEYDLAGLVEAGDVAAREKMIKANLRLVVSVAKRHVGGSLTLLDLIQEGNLGLEKAIDRFDRSKGFKLSTYATWWIKQSIRRAIGNQGQTIRIPIHMDSDIRRMERASEMLALEFGRPPTDAELAREMDTKEDAVAVMREARVKQHLSSLDLPIGDGDAVLGDIVKDPNDRTPEDIVVDKSLEEELGSILNETLDGRERQVVVLRFGMCGHAKQTLEEIGEGLGVTRERVRQIERRALEKLREHKDIEALSVYLS